MNFGGLDFAVLVLYMAGVTAWGAWLGRANRGGTDYFLGSRNLPWWAVMLSVVATETSTLTFLSIPGVAYLGTLAFLQLAIGYLAGRAVVAWVLLPAYYRGELSTAYALLETRFGGAARRYASGVFMVTRLLADSVRLFATAIPLAIITGWSYPVSILVIGAATLAYTYRGGIKAVVWVDALQMTLYVGGGLIALLLLHMAVDGGWSAILASAGSAGKMQVLDFSASPAVAYTFWAGLIGGGFLSMASHGTDQLIVQRLLTCRDVVQSRRALVGSGFAVIVQFALFLFVGLGLWVFFEGREFAGSDEIFARFIIEEMPAGVRGLLIAGVFAAAMSSLSSSINSLASASAYDFWGPLRRRRGGGGSTETGGDGGGRGHRRRGRPRHHDRGEDLHAGVGRTADCGRDRVHTAVGGYGGGGGGAGGGLDGVRGAAGRVCAGRAYAAGWRDGCDCRDDGGRGDCGGDLGDGQERGRVAVVRVHRAGGDGGGGIGSQDQALRTVGESDVVPGWNLVHVAVDAAPDFWIGVDGGGTRSRALVGDREGREVGTARDGGPGLIDPARPQATTVEVTLAAVAREAVQTGCRWRSPCAPCGPDWRARAMSAHGRSSKSNCGALS